jgi:predicted Zn-ribbon and HTH transcriptional regulator
MDKKTCKHCGYTWQPRIETEPRACPKCKSPRWAEEPRKAGRPKGQKGEKDE